MKSGCFFSRKLTNLEGAHECLIDRHHATGIIELAAVVRCREESDKMTLRKKLIPILHHLMGTANKIKVVTVQEFLHNIRAEDKTDTSVILTPSFSIFVRIGPKNITEKTYTSKRPNITIKESDKVKGI